MVFLEIDDLGEVELGGSLKGPVWALERSFWHDRRGG